MKENIEGQRYRYRYRERERERKKELEKRISKKSIKYNTQTITGYQIFLLPTKTSALKNCLYNNNNNNYNNKNNNNNNNNIIIINNNNNNNDNNDNNKRIYIKYIYMCVYVRICVYIYIYILYIFYRQLLLHAIDVARYATVSRESKL